MNRAVAAAAGAIVTALLVYLALLLGAWGFDTRRYLQHETRLARLLDHQPRLEQVVEAFAGESTVLVAAADTPAELERVARAKAGPKAREVLDKGARWPRLRVFLAGDMLYFAYFDAAGVMRGFTLVSR